MNGKCRRGRRRSQGDTSPESRAHSRRRSVRQLACKWGDPAAAGRAPGFQLPAFVFDLPASVLGCPTSVLGCPTSVLGCPISVLGCPISVLGCPISFSDGPTSALGCPASVVNPPPFPQNPPTSGSELPHRAVALPNPSTPPRRVGSSVRSQRPAPDTASLPALSTAKVSAYGAHPPRRPAPGRDLGSRLQIWEQLCSDRELDDRHRELHGRHRQLRNK